MKGINYIFCFTIALLCFGCNDEEDRLFTSTDGAFVRFFLLVDNDNNALEYPQVNGGLIPVNTYQYNKFLPLKIPVALSTSEIETPITVNFSTEINNVQGVTISPQNQLTFTNERLVDTIQVHFETPWNGVSDASIRLALTEASHPNIAIGMPNTNNSNNELVINFSDVNFIYHFETDSKLIEGNLNETFDFKVLFPNGFVNEDVDFNDLLDAPENNFQYSVIFLDATANHATYAFTLDEDLSQFQNETFSESIQFNPLPEQYVLSSPSQFEIATGRPSQTLTSSNFFDTSNPFFRLFGERWFFDDGDNQCEWQAWNVFTAPVDVAISGVFDSNGDGYHDERIGFVSPNAPIGTNPFDIRRIINGESVMSPGLNMAQALDFIPDELSDGSYSETNGLVRVIPNSIILTKTADDSTITIPIVSSGGTYQLIDETTNLWQLNFNIVYDFSTIGGPPDATYYYVMYSQSGQPEPEPLTENCFGSYDL